MISEIIVGAISTVVGGLFGFLAKLFFENERLKVELEQGRIDHGGYQSDALICFRIRNRHEKDAMIEGLNMKVRAAGHKDGYIQDINRMPDAPREVTSNRKEEVRFPPDFISQRLRGSGHEGTVKIRALVATESGKTFKGR